MPSSISTRITKLLDKEGILYRTLPHSAPALTVDSAARQRGVPKGEMVKCILLRDKDAHYVMACVPGDVGVDPSAVRMYVPEDWRRLYFATLEEISEVTGFPQGAVAPIGITRDIPVIFDEAVLTRSKVNISSGDPMAGVELDPNDLVRLCGASVAAISKGKE